MAARPLCCTDMQDRAPWWLPDGHSQTIWAALWARPGTGSLPTWHRERWDTPDGDFIDVDWLQASSPARPWLVVFHGLEGSSQSHYARAFAHWALRHDVQLVLPHFRGCSGELNRAPRAYHSGDHEEIHWILVRLRAHHRSAGGRITMAAGVSLGGNALMRWAAEHGHAAQAQVDAIASICAPLDLSQSGAAIGRGLNRQIYTRMFLRSMKPKALAKLAQHPGLFDRKRLMAARDLYEFDNVFTAPLHGFRDTADYWQRASAKPGMGSIRVPALALNACNDPFIPADSLPQPQDVSPQVTLWQPRHGGHVGFAAAPWPGTLQPLPEAVGGWLLAAAGGPAPEVAHG
jgi:predicted alpha/beta-fold hydrolase